MNYFPPVFWLVQVTPDASKFEVVPITSSAYLIHAGHYILSFLSSSHWKLLFSV